MKGFICERIQIGRDSDRKGLRYEGFQELRFSDKKGFK